MFNPALLSKKELKNSPPPLKLILQLNFAI